MVPTGAPEPLEFRAVSTAGRALERLGESGEGHRSHGVRVRRRRGRRWQEGRRVKHREAPRALVERFDTEFNPDS